MRYMLLLKGDLALDRLSEHALDEQAQALAKYESELTRAGVLLDSEALYPSARGVLMTNRGGALTIVDGPFRDQRHILSAVWTLQVKSKEEAIEWAKRCPLASEQQLVELGRVTELADFGLAPPDGAHEPPAQTSPSDELESHCPKPEEHVVPHADKPLRYLMMFRGDAKSEAGLPPPMETFVEMGKLIGEMTAAGVALTGEGLRPSREGARVVLSEGQRRVIDGPFAETKELVAGYMLVQVSSKEECLLWAKRGALVNGDCVSEIRQVRTRSVP